MSLKLFFQNTLLILVSVVIGYYSVFGPQGIVTYGALKQQLDKEKRDLVRLNKNINVLKQTISKHHSSQFELEKIARYDFCMGYTNELIYVLPKAL